MKNITTIKFDLYNLVALLGVGALGYAFWSVRGFILMIIVAIVISMFAEDFVVRLRKYKSPRILSVILFYLLMGVVFFGIILFMVPVIINEIKVLSEFYPELLRFINLDFLTGTFDEVSSVKDVFAKAKDLSLQKFFNSLGSVFGSILNVVIVFILSFYLSMQDHSIDRVLKIFTPKKYEESVLRVWESTQKKIGGWFRGQLIVALLLVIITYIGLGLMGVPYALLLSLLAGLFGFVPYGIFIAVLPAIGIGMIHNGWKIGIFIVVFYFLVQQLLDYVIQPLLFKRMTGIPPLLVILSVIIGVKLFGVPGLIIAIPMALFVLEIIAEIESQKEALPTEEANNGNQKLTE